MTYKIYKHEKFNSTVCNPCPIFSLHWFVLWRPSFDYKYLLLTFTLLFLVIYFTEFNGIYYTIKGLKPKEKSSCIIPLIFSEKMFLISMDNIEINKISNSLYS